MKLRIGFILAVNDTDVQWFKPLSFGYLKSYLEKYSNLDVDMVYLDTLDRVAEFDVICVSATSQCFDIAKKLSVSIKKVRSSIVTILGGHHITALPQTLPREFDLGVVGEGEATFLELVETLSGHGMDCSPDLLRSISGIVYHDGDQIRETPRRPPIHPLDSLPIPHREPGGQVYLFTSRGCPYKCSFCSSTAFWENTRFFSADYVVKELEHIAEKFPEHSSIAILDDLFVADKPRFKRFVEVVAQKRYNERFSFYFSVRANLVDDDLCADLKRLNVGGVSFGAESGSDRILELLQKGTTVVVNQRAIDLFHRYQIPVRGSFIVGVPSETEEEVRSTYEFILKNIFAGKLLPGCSVNILMPLPGTEVWRQATLSGTIDPATVDWAHLSVFASYRDSKLESFEAWVEARKDNHSIYLAEETLPEARLYELMYLYENAIKAVESQQQLEVENMHLIREKNALLNTLSWKITAPLRQARKIIIGD